MAEQPWKRTHDGRTVAGALAHRGLTPRHVEAAQAGGRRAALRLYVTARLPAGQGTRQCHAANLALAAPLAMEGEQDIAAGRLIDFSDDGRLDEVLAEASRMADEMIYARDLTSAAPEDVVEALAFALRHDEHGRPRRGAATGWDFAAGIATEHLALGTPTWRCRWHASTAGP